jgi:hypothetical protein
LAVALVACSASSEKPKQFHRHGIAFEYPESWFVTTRPISNGVNPVYRFTVSTVPVRRTRADQGPCTPGIAKQVPPDGVLAYLREGLGPLDRDRALPRMPTRPRSFPLPNATSTALCGWSRRGLWIPFKDGGRAFYLGVYVGRKATASTRRALRHLLDGMEIQARSKLAARFSRLTPGAGVLRVTFPHAGPAERRRLRTGDLAQAA